MASTKEALQAKINALRKELAKITDAEEAAENEAFLGKCFKTRNSYGVSSSVPDWLMYSRVIGIAEDGGLLTIRFEDDNETRLHASIHDHDHAGTLRSYTEISEEEFMNAWNNFKLRVVNLKVTP